MRLLTSVHKSLIDPNFYTTPNLYLGATFPNRAAKTSVMTRLDRRWPPACNWPSCQEVAHVGVAMIPNAVLHLFKTVKKLTEPLTRASYAGRYAAKQD
ncbi:hypothetical protein BaRGS_00001814 [Batillaria attramentaria]|uniref:Uncharacterized protein n=1 Tax=Batillaria attramentaria TaxID=370345 RepID=A0ABD0M5B9_9CAEN